MSILNDLVRDVASLLFPPRCAVCGEPLARGERTVCTLCRATAPLTGYWREADNPVVRRCWGMVPVCQASGFLFFVRASGWRWLIHGFKPRRERAGNVEDAFAVRRPERLAGRHVLLVDDVMTTGSTLLSCASAILRDAPGCRISIAALAVSQRELGVKE